MKEYKSRHDWEAKVINYELCKRLNFVDIESIVIYANQYPSEKIRNKIFLGI